MATTKKKTPKKSKKSAQSAGHRARIRMYRVGLGDCFLLTFYTQARPRNILIDCGMFAGSRLDTSQKEKDVQLAVVKSIVSETKGKLDAVVVTHEHMDHVSIFNSAQDVFKDLTFDEAWFGWVEDPKNKDAQKLREKYEGLKMALAAALTGLQGLARTDPNYEELHSGVASVAEFTGLAADGSISQQPRTAIEFVKKKAGKQNLRFGSPGDIWKFAGLKIYVLGPPTAEKQLRVMERAGASYDRAFAVADETGKGPTRLWYPFSEQWRQPVLTMVGKARIDLEGAHHNAELEGLVARYNDARDAWRSIGNLALDSASDLALQMDKYINNTSLVLAFEFDNKDVLLFPGDAQVGNWDSWFEIKKKGFDVADLLRRTIFYKVGHHGSHNATLKEALERMKNPKLVAMIPTNEQFARESKHWTMPAPKLNEALKDHTQNRLLRNDQGFNKVPDLKADDWVGVGKVEVDPLYIDYYV
jgi:beta-lactamase superfamily II metal-dependent hydrolase